MQVACYPVGVSMWRQGIRVVCVDEALARERAELQKANAAAAQELAAVQEQRLFVERQRREVVKELRGLQEQCREVVADGNRRKGSTRRGVDANGTAAQVTASLREESLVEELKLLRRQRNSALQLVSSRAHEAAEKLASVEETASAELEKVVARAAKAEEKLGRDLEKRKASEQQLRASLRQVEAHNAALMSSHAKAESALETARINSAKLEKKAAMSASSALCLQRTLAARARWWGRRGQRATMRLRLLTRPSVACRISRMWRLSS